MPNRDYVVAKILLFDGVALIVLAFVHLLATPIVNYWLTRELTMDTFRTAPPYLLFNHVFIGIMLIPFGVSTLFSAAGVRAGHPWARAVAITNALAIIVLPLIVIITIGAQSFDTTPFLIAGIAITFIGVTMFVPLVWIKGRSGDRRLL